MSKDFPVAVLVALRLTISGEIWRAWTLCDSPMWLKRRVLTVSGTYWRKGREGLKDRRSQAVSPCRDSAPLHAAFSLLVPVCESLFLPKVQKLQRCFEMETVIERLATDPFTFLELV